MIMNQKDIQESIQCTYENAQRFLDDSKILQKKGSLGHATSLAILGYEEATKALQLTKFHPYFEGFYSKDDLKLLKKRLSTSHHWKQHYALELRISLEPFIDTISEKDRNEIGLPSKKEIQEGTEFVLSEKLDKMKNDGFYANAFRKPKPWCPSEINKTTTKFAQKLLKTQLESVVKVVEVLSQLDKFPQELLSTEKTELMKVASSLRLAQAENVKDLEEFAKRMSKHGLVGEIVISLARAYITDERFKITEKERKKK